MTLMEHAGEFSLGQFVKKEIAAVRHPVEQGRSVKEACRMAGIARCEYYRALRLSEKAKSDAALVRLMCDIENDRHVSSTYGVERLTGEVNNRLAEMGEEQAAAILRNGAKVNHKRIHRLIKSMAFIPAYAAKSIRMTTAKR